METDEMDSDLQFLAIAEFCLDKLDSTLAGY